MKVLHVETGRHLYGGARQVVYLLEGLQNSAVENILVCPSGSEISEAAKSYAQVETVRAGGDLDIGFVFRLKKIIKREKPDLVHLHSRRGADVLGGIAARLAGVPCVLSRRVDNPEPSWLVGIKYRLYERVITISDGIRLVLLAEGVAADKLVCVHSVVDPEPFQHTCECDVFRREFGLPEKGMVIGMIAQFIPRKGHHFLLDVLPEVLEKYPDLQVRLFGQGPLTEEIESRIRHENLQGRVQLTGFRNDLERWLSCLDLVVHPAEMEGLGVSLLQAAAAGIAIIGNRAGGIPEIVRDGENGLLIEPGDKVGWTNAMISLLSDAGLRQKMAEKGREIVTMHFSPKVMVAGNLAVYQAILNP